MGHYEDEFIEIYNAIENHGLRKEYDTQIEKMRAQDKHKYKDAKEYMRYACDKVVIEQKEKHNI